MSDDVKQLALLPGQFAWCKDEKSGTLVMYVGPTRLTPTDDDIFMKQNPDKPDELIPVSSIREAVQNFVTIHPGEYAVVHNPVVIASDDYPNGKFGKDKNSLESLDYGKTRVLTKGHFPIWPGQRVELRPVHELFSNQYLVVRVVDAERVDTKAPYYPITLECAGTTKAVVDAQGEGDKPQPIEPTSEGDKP